MDIETHSIFISTNGNSDIIDITGEIESILDKTCMIEGNVLIFVGGSTGGITTIEYEPGLLQDYPQFFDRIAPKNIPYEHDNTWHDGNGHSHVRAAIQSASLTVPFKDKKLLLGTWQQVVAINHDNKPRTRTIHVTIFSQA